MSPAMEFLLRTGVFKVGLFIGATTFVLGLVFGSRANPNDRDMLTVVTASSVLGFMLVLVLMLLEPRPDREPFLELFGAFLQRK